MMSNNSQHSIDEAIGWVIRLRHGGAGDWEEFTLWLEADTSNLQAYEAVAAADADAERLPAKTEPPALPSHPVLPERPWLRRRTALAWAVAATLVGVIGYGSLDRGRDTYALETAPGQRRIIALQDGSRIDLNGTSKIVLDRDDPRFARIERGEALFTVVHDEAARFRVEAGDAEIEDLGTVFNVVHEQARLSVEVAEGAVSVSAPGARADVSAGMSASLANGKLATARLDPASIGEWQRGLLSYSSASLVQVARDLSRNAGLQLSVSPELENRRFSGVIILDPDRDKLLRRVLGLLMVDVRPAGEGWLLVPADR